MKVTDNSNSGYKTCRSIYKKKNINKTNEKLNLKKFSLSNNLLQWTI